MGIEKDLAIIDYFSHPLRKSEKWLKYIQDGNWKCDKAPAGAHFWIINKIVHSGNIISSKMKCKYCGEKKIISRTI